MMGAFLFAAMSLVAITMLMLLRPWQRGRAGHDASVRELDAAVCRDQLAELDRDRAAGTIAGADWTQAREELQRRLLDDSAAAPASGLPVQRGRHTALMLAIALPLAATGLYALLGTPAGLVPTPIANAGAGAGAGAGAHPTTDAEVEQMVRALAARLEKNPDDPRGWAMLARTYHAMGRMAEAQAAFARIGDDLQKDPVLLADYADVLATRADGNVEGEPLRLVTAALRLDPDNAMALSLAATAAYKRGDLAEAATHWRRLLKALPPGSDDARWVQGTLAEIGVSVAPAMDASVARVAGPSAASGVAMNRAGAGVVPSGNAMAVAPPGKAIAGIVDLAPALQASVRPTDTVFVFARATDGSRIPLAVQRARVADLPLRFRLDDSMAMSPQAKLSGAKEVRIEARVSRDGSATPAAGDAIGASQPVAPGNEAVVLTIDRLRP